MALYCLRSAKKFFDQVSSFICVPVVTAVDLSVRLRGDDSGFPCRTKHGQDPLVGIIGLVGEQGGGLHGRKKAVGADEVVRLTAGEEKADRVAQGVEQCVDFGAQAASRATDGLVVAVFFLAPALC